MSMTEMCLELSLSLDLRSAISHCAALKTSVSIAVAGNKWFSTKQAPGASASSGSEPVLALRWTFIHRTTPQQTISGLNNGLKLGDKIKVILKNHGEDFKPF